MNKTKSLFVAAAVFALAMLPVGCTPAAALAPSGAVGWEAVENGTPADLAAAALFAPNEILDAAVDGAVSAVSIPVALAMNKPAGILPGCEQASFSGILSSVGTAVGMFTAAGASVVTGGAATPAYLALAGSLGKDYLGCVLTAPPKQVAAETSSFFINDEGAGADGLHRFAAHPHIVAVADSRWVESPASGDDGGEGRSR